MTKKVVFRIRRIYFDAIVAGTKIVELRKFTQFWQRRLCGTDTPKIAVFICGKDVHRRKIVGVSVGSPEAFLARPLSGQEKLDIPTQICIGIYLGDAIE